MGCLLLLLWQQSTLDQFAWYLQLVQQQIKMDDIYCRLLMCIKNGKTGIVCVKLCKV